jgi:biotin carboxylase
VGGVAGVDGVSAGGGTGLPPLAIVYDAGAVSPIEIAHAARGLCEVVLVADPVALAAQLPVLEQVGTLVPHGPGTGADTTVRRLKDLGAAGITTFTDSRLGLTADLAQALGLRFHTPEVARRLNDKLHQRTRLAAAGMPVVRFAELSGAEGTARALAAVGVPAVLKPRQGAGSRSTFPVDTAQEFDDVARRLLDAGEDQLIAEERLLGDPSVVGERWGDYVSVESVVDDERITHVGITGKLPLAEPFREGGVFFPSTLGPQVAEEALAQTERALRHLGVVSGITHTEFKLTAHGPRLIEVNGRLGGFLNDLVARATGVSMLRIALENALATGTPVPERIDRTAERVAFQRFAQPPVDAVAVREVTGTKETRRLPGTARVELVRRSGDPVDWRQGTQSFTAIVYGAASDHTALDTALAAVDATLRISYECSSDNHAGDLVEQ